MSERQRRALNVTGNFIHIETCRGVFVSLLRKSQDILYYRSGSMCTCVCVPIKPSSRLILHVKCAVSFTQQRLNFQNHPICKSFQWVNVSRGAFAESQSLLCIWHCCCWTIQPRVYVMYCICEERAEWAQYEIYIYERLRCLLLYEMWTEGAVTRTRTRIVLLKMRRNLYFYYF